MQREKPECHFAGKTETRWRNRKIFALHRHKDLINHLILIPDHALHVRDTWMARATGFSRLYGPCCPRKIQPRVASEFMVLLVTARTVFTSYVQYDADVDLTFIEVRSDIRVCKESKDANELVFVDNVSSIGQH